MSSSKISVWRKRADRLTAEHAAATMALKRARRSVIDSEQAADDADEAQQIVQAVAETVQEEAHNRIAGVVTKCLEIFDNPYEFHIIFERARGRTEARLVFTKDGQIVDPITGSGGGAVDVAAFALRLSCLMLSKPPMRRVLILDEPFKFVSECFRGRVRHLLETMATEMQIQIIMVTHIRELETGYTITLS